MLSLSQMVQCSQIKLDSSVYEVVAVNAGRFYHYGCNSINDVGWGCGYRTLQTLCSWAVEHLQSDVSVPSLSKIQEVLVEVGDKPLSFVGSRQWIGSYEASIVMDQLYKVSCRLLHLKSGSEVIGICPVLQYHFQTVGSPIMIGGDVDAASKTLLGVAKSKLEAGDQWQFLIADPHYVGEDDVTHILEKEGLKWHNMKLFEDSSFYNFCLPLNI